MIFQKPVAKATFDASETFNLDKQAGLPDEVETIVGPSVNVEGDFASEGNIVVKGTVAGSVHTSRHLSVEPGAKIMANVRAGSARIAGEVKGNMKVKETLELTASAKVMGDLEAKIMVVEAGALISGKVNMPGLDGEAKLQRPARPLPVKKPEDTAIVL